jgi:LEA14-like dessication related protein
MLCNPRSRLASVAVLSLFWLFATGCAGLRPNIEAPQVRLAQVQLLSAGLLEQRFRLMLRVNNPNDIAVPIKGIQYAVRLADADFASGSTPKAFRIPALGEELVAVDVSTNLLASAQHLMTYLQSGPSSMNYELSGKVQVDLPLIGGIPFAQSGQVPLTMMR